MRCRIASFAGIIASTCFLLHAKVTTASSTSTRNLRYGEHDADSTVTAIDGGNSAHNRHLYLFSVFSDPQSVESKTLQQSEFQQQVESSIKAAFPVEANGKPRPLNVLSFGGSVTWGAKVSNRLEQTYPELIGAPNLDHVDNFAIRATGADYPSLCLESILSEAQVPPDQSYDIIFVEFVLNGMKGLPRLLRRLKHYYPDAVIVFVELWSVLGDAVERGTNRTVFEVGPDSSIDWVWMDNPSLTQFLKGISAFVFGEIGGYMYKLPMPERPIEAIERGWFADDWQHLSEIGHEFLAEDMMRMLTSSPDVVHRLISNQKRIGSKESHDRWAVRDHCFNWFESGIVPPPPEFYYEGANLRDLLDLNPNEFKWLLEFSPGGGFIKVNSNFPGPVPLTLGYMTRMDPAEYPLVEVMVNGHNPIVLDPNVNNSKHLPKAHITSFTEVGWVEPGENIITIKPMEERRDLFRLSGVIMYAGRQATQNDLIELDQQA
mmetsp:Transcript_38931/g.57287  ORF Transcript_38931/g.57287 Transcript_38931/m.57287 type:complete len:489 (-) Transcript_38931:101-1567(-)